MDLKEKSTEKLQAELKAMKIINGALIIVLSLLFLLCAYNLLFNEDKKGVFGALIVVPISLSAILPMNFGNIKQINNEIESRK